VSADGEWGFEATMIRTELRRAYPRELSTDELSDLLIDLRESEIAAGVRELFEGEVLDREAQGIVLANAEAIPEGATPEVETEQRDDDVLVAPAPAPVTPKGWIPGGTVRHDYRVTLTVPSDGAAEDLQARGRALETQVADAVADRIPGAVVEVDLTEIAVFDVPRTVWSDEGNSDE